MNRFTSLLESASVVLGRFDHPGARRHRDPGEETSAGYAISIVEQGSFKLCLGQRRWSLGPGMAFLTSPALTYRVRHFEPYPSDVCLTVSYRRRFLEGADGPDFRLPPAFRSPARAASNRLGYLRLRLAGAARSKDTLAAESRAADLLAMVTQVDRGATRLFRPQQLAWYAERIEAARWELESRFAESHSLSALAAGVGMSPFHFARVFRELVGVPPHRYLLRVRVAEARRQLRAGASVTQACFSCGFNNLSHFIRACRRAWGAPPSQLKK